MEFLLCNKEFAFYNRGMLHSMDVYKGIFFHVISVGVRVLFNDSSREKQPFAGVLQNRSQMFKRVLTKAVSRRCSVKKVFLEISQNSPENTCARVSFLIKLRASACNFIKKEALAQVFFCEFYEICENTFSYKTTPVAASFLNTSLVSISVFSLYEDILTKKSGSRD